MLNPKNPPTKKARAEKDHTVTARHATTGTTSKATSTTVVTNSEIDNLGATGVGTEEVVLSATIKALNDVSLNSHEKTQLELTLTEPPVLTTPSPVSLPPNVATSSFQSFPMLVELVISSPPTSLTNQTSSSSASHLTIISIPTQQSDNRTNQ